MLAQGAEVFYDNSGNSDFALITDFDLSQDVIQLLDSQPGNVNEIGDAEQNISDAQVIPSSTTPLETISGTISNNGQTYLNYPSCLQIW